MNQLTSGHLDPVSKIPEFKASAVRLEPLGVRAPVPANPARPPTEAVPLQPAGGSPEHPSPKRR